MDDSTWFLAKELGHTNSVMYPSSFKAICKPIFSTALRLKCMVLTHPWSKQDMYLAGWVGTENICSDDGSVGTLAVLDADCSVITKYRSQRGL